MKKLIIILFFVYIQINYAQVNLEQLKDQAKSHIEYGRFGEAIDLLNKYVTAHARNAEGYYLRGFCFEKREVYEYAVLDYRRAVHLEQSNKKYQAALQKALSVFHQKLYERIDGYKRELAINPNKAFNYLEIGKCYRWLEEWQDAEKWYDDYLARDDNASPDEIIRYTEILSHTGSIKKGEIVLKKYVARYPDDWRLWSRYGYFTMWLGNYENARKAFNSALEYKPFFKEAQDGLDLAEKKGYLTKFSPRSFEKEFPIDKYYSQLKKNPRQDEIRFKLLYELINENRLEEAQQQLNFLQPRYADSTKFQELFKKVETIRDSVYQTKIAEYKTNLEANKDDKESIVKLAESYARVLYYDEAIKLLKEYLEAHPEDEALDIRFTLSQYSAWNYNWEDAIAQLDFLLEKSPDNTKYQLLRGQVAVWTVLELDKAESLLKKVLEKENENIPAILSLISLYSWQKKFPEAKEYLDLAKKIDPLNPDVEAAQSNYEIHLAAFEEYKILQIREEAGELSKNGDCEGAVRKYDEYLSKISAPSKDELLEYADFSICAKIYDKPLAIYDTLLVKEPDDLDLMLRRAKVYYWTQDTLRAIEEFEKVVDGDPENYDAKVFLGHSYLLGKDYDKAIQTYESLVDQLSDTTVVEMVNQSKFAAKLSIGDSFTELKEYTQAYEIYNGLLKETTDTAQISMIKQRISWIPAHGFSAFLDNSLGAILPSYIALSPYYYYYDDNQNLNYYYYGTKLLIGLNRFITVGGSFVKNHIKSRDITVLNTYRDFTELKGTAVIYFNEFIKLEGSYGQIQTLNEPKKKIWETTFSIDKEKQLRLILGYKRTDHRIHLYSPNNIGRNKDLDYFNFLGEYYFQNLLKFKVTYDYLKIFDNNRGNNLALEIGKYFAKEICVGYQFSFSDFARRDPYYFAPQNLEAHSLWAEWEYKYEDSFKAKLYGKIGYAPSVDFILRTFNAEMNYYPTKNLILSASFNLGSSYRYDSSYDFFSSYFSIYFSL